MTHEWTDFRPKISCSIVNFNDPNERETENDFEYVIQLSIYGSKLEKNIQIVFSFLSDFYREYVQTAWLIIVFATFILKSRIMKFI